MSDGQIGLFDVATYANGRFPGARNTRTSKAAAHALAPRLNEMRLRVLRAFATVTDATADEIAALLGLANTQTRPRCTDLCREPFGYLVPTGEERRTPLGGTAAVLKITENGRKYLADVDHGLTMRQAS